MIFIIDRRVEDVGQKKRSV